MPGEAEGSGQWWQMPQGGIDQGEEPRDTALRELEEEIGTAEARIIAETKGWLSYDLPADIVPTVWKGRYRGQTQKWFALRFTGEDSEVNLAPPGHKQEFDAWRWAQMEEIVDLTIPFKRQVYAKVIAAFRHLGR